MQVAYSGKTEDVVGQRQLDFENVRHQLVQPGGCQRHNYIITTTIIVIINNNVNTTTAATYTLSYMPISLQPLASIGQPLIRLDHLSSM